MFAKHSSMTSEMAPSGVKESKCGCAINDDQREPVKSHGETQIKDDGGGGIGGDNRLTPSWSPPRQHTDPVSINDRGSSSSVPSPDPSTTILDDQHPMRSPNKLLRLPLRQYGGPLSTIPESPQLQSGALLAHTTHRRSTSLTLPPSTLGPNRRVAPTRHRQSASLTLPSSTHDPNIYSSESRSCCSQQRKEGEGKAKEKFPIAAIETANLIVDFPQHDDANKDLIVNFPPRNNKKVNQDKKKIIVQKLFEEAAEADCRVQSHNNYDSQGRCVRHPHIRLRTRSIFGTREWKVIMNACPDCCIDELTRIRSKQRVALDGLRESTHGTRSITEHDSDDDDDDDDSDANSSLSSGSSRTGVSSITWLSKRDSERERIKPR